MFCSDDVLPAQSRSKIAARLPRAVLGVFWILCVAVGLGKLWRYESVPGPMLPSPAHWPAGSRLARLPGEATLVVAAHPQCPCTRASLSELARALAHTRIPLRVYLLFYRPKGAPADWEKTDLYAKAAALPGVHLVSDEDGREARKL